ncbi:MAG: ABC transporter permease [Spirochaetales bacterium]|nr:ABC transporter permease [Spirochaetales bacterium]
MKVNYFISDIFYVCLRDLKHYLKQRVRIMATLIQPIIWLVLIGNLMSGLTANPLTLKFLDAPSYLDFMAPGVMVMTTLFTGLFAGVRVVWDRRLEILQKMLSTPLSRTAIPLGKIAAAVVQGNIQVIIVLLTALMLGVTFKTGLAGIMVILIFISLFCSIMASISIALSVNIRNMETFFALMNFITMPLMLTSKAMFPVEAMPGWLKFIAEWNPISYAVIPLRTLVTKGWDWTVIWQSLIILCFFALCFLAGAVFFFKRARA